MEEKPADVHKQINGPASENANTLQIPPRYLAEHEHVHFAVFPSLSLQSSPSPLSGVLNIVSTAMAREPLL